MGRTKEINLYDNDFDEDDEFNENSQFRVKKYFRKKWIKLFKDKEKTQESITWSPDSKYFAILGDSDETINIWNAKTKKIENSITLEEEFGEKVEWSPYQDYISIIGSSGDLHIYETQEYNKVKTIEASFEIDRDVPQFTIWSPDEFHILIYEESEDVDEGNIDEVGNTISIYSTSSWNKVSSLHPDYDYEFVFWASKGTIIFTGSFLEDDRIRLECFSAPDWKKLNFNKIDAIPELFRANFVSWDDGGNCFLTQYKDKIQIIDANSLKILSKWRKKIKTPIQNVAWSRNLEYVVLDVEDRQPEIRKLKNGKNRGNSLNFEESIEKILWSPQGNKILICGEDGSISLFEAPSGEFLTYLHDIDYDFDFNLAGIQWSPLGDRLIIPTYSRKLWLGKVKGHIKKLKKKDLRF